MMALFKRTAPPIQTSLEIGIRLGWQGWLDNLLAHPVRHAIQMLAIALGVALGLAVHLIHASALDSFAAGVRQFSGTADRVIRGPKVGFDIQVADRLLQQPEIDLVSPVVELDVALTGLDKPVRWLGVDFMRAAGITPHLIGQTEDADDFFDTHAVFLSPALLLRLQRDIGEILVAEGPDGPVQWRIAGQLTQAPADSLMVVSDIAAAQWRWNVGTLVQRIDIKAAEGVPSTALDNTLNAALEPGLWLDNPDEAGSRGAAVSRAYRVNLTILALVALLTGGFLIYATQTLAAMERNRQWALLNALGADPQVIQAQVLTEAVLSGVLGSLTGLGLGIATASVILGFLGADLGSGFFQGQKPSLIGSPVHIAPFFALGMACSLLGAWRPAREAAGTPGVAALKPGQAGEQAMQARWHPAALAALLACPLLAFLPPVAGLPLGGYAAIGCGLLGGIACMPALLQAITPSVQVPKGISALSHLKTRHSPGHSGIALAGIVASFSLVVAMAIMVNSFRDSLANWLDDVLPAPLYMRLQAGDTIALEPAVQMRLRQVAGVDRAEFWTSEPVVLEPQRPAPALVIRPIDASQPQSRLPLVQGTSAPAPAGHTPVWISEAIVRLYGWQLDSRQQLVLPGTSRPSPLWVAGIWRDYARQQGSIVMDVEAARRAGVPVRLTDASFWPQAGVSTGELMNRLKSELESQTWARRVEFAETQFLRAISLAIFDRSFAVTYLLEAVAIGIGLLGIASTFAATALARKHEFAALMALGADTRSILRLLLAEGFSVALVGMLVGMALGLVFSLILIHVINPQSFNWTMDVHMPWGILGGLAITLVALASLTAGLSGWTVLKRNALDVLKHEHA